MSDGDNLVRFEIKEDVAYLTLDNPPVNIMTAAMMDEIAEHAARIAEQDTLKAVVFRAEGKAFSAGADVAEHAPDMAETMIKAFSGMFTALFALDIPVIMAVDGAALGGGFELVMAGDMVIATEGAKFGQPEIKLGFFAPLGVAYLPTLVGYRRAMEITCTGRTYDAQTMRDWGFVSEVVALEALDETVEKLLRDLRYVSPLVLRMNVRALRQTMALPVQEGHVAAERVFLDELMKTEEVVEGIASFSEKRKPQWKNR